MGGSSETVKPLRHRSFFGSMMHCVWNVIIVATLTINSSGLRQEADLQRHGSTVWGKSGKFSMNTYIPFSFKIAKAGFCDWQKKKKKKKALIEASASNDSLVITNISKKSRD